MEKPPLEARLALVPCTMHGHRETRQIRRASHAIQASLAITLDGTMHRVALPCDGHQVVSQATGRCLVDQRVHGVGRLGPLWRLTKFGNSRYFCTIIPLRPPLQNTLRRGLHGNPRGGGGRQQVAAVYISERCMRAAMMSRRLMHVFCH